MGFGNSDVLKARVNNFDDFITSIGSTKLTEIDSEVSDLIFQKTSVPVPSSPTSAPGTLKGIWADIVLFKVITWQTDLSDEEKERRKLLFEAAMKLLDDIQSGDVTLKDGDGSELVSSADSSPFKFTGTKRITTTP